MITTLLQLELLNLIKKPEITMVFLKQVSFAVLAHSFLITQPTSYQSQRVGNPQNVEGTLLPSLIRDVVIASWNPILLSEV